MVSGVIGGCACGMIVWLYLSSREEGGLAAEYFVKNTGKVLPHPIFNLILIFHIKHFRVISFYAFSRSTPC